MKANPDATYIARVTGRTGNAVWTRPVKGDGCGDMNNARDTLEEVGQFLAMYVADPCMVAKIELFEIPTASVAAFEYAKKGAAP